MRTKHSKQCTVDGCRLVHYALGYCRSHYERVRKYGDPTAGPRPVGGHSRMPAAFADHGITHRQVEWMVERGHIRVALDERGLRQWQPSEVAIGVLAYRLHQRGLTLELAARLAREYVGESRDTLRWELMPGFQLRLSTPASRAVGK